MEARLSVAEESKLNMVEMGLATPRLWFPEESDDVKSPGAGPLLQGKGHVVYFFSPHRVWTRNARDQSARAVHSRTVALLRTGAPSGTMVPTLGSSQQAGIRVLLKAALVRTRLSCDLRRCRMIWPPAELRPQK